MEHEFSDDPDTPLNQKIAEAWRVSQEDYHVNDKRKHECICQQIYEMGFNDGQAYVYRMRQMIFVDDPKNPGKQKGVFPGDPDYPKTDEFITVVSS